MTRRLVVRLIIPSLFAPILLSCEDKNKSLNNSSMWYEAPSMSDKSMETKVREILSNGERLKFRWDCGGDEAIISLDRKTPGNISPDKFEDSLYPSLTLYILNFLNLPDVGEFSMEGGGEFKLVADEELIFEFESVMNSYIDYNPETNEVKEVNEPKIDSTFTGIKIPFK